MLTDADLLMAPGVEGAARGKVDDVWRLSFNGEEPLCLVTLIHSGNRCDESLGVGMGRGCIELLCGCLLDDYRRIFSVYRYANYTGSGIEMEVILDDILYGRLREYVVKEC